MNETLILYLLYGSVIFAFLSIPIIYWYNSRYDPVDKRVIVKIKTPQGWEERKVKVKDNKIKIDGKEIPIPSGKGEKDKGEWERRGFLRKRWIKVYYVDPEKTMILDPKDPNYINTNEAKISLLVGNLLTSMAKDKKKENILYITIIAVVLIAIVGMIMVHYIDQKAIIEISNSINNLIEYMKNQTSIPPPLTQSGG